MTQIPSKIVKGWSFNTSMAITNNVTHISTLVESIKVTLVRLAAFIVVMFQGVV